MTIEVKIKSVVRDVPDFPKAGIIFKDITPIMMNAEVSNEILNHLVETYKNVGLTKIAGIESRGFLFGYPLAMKLGIPFVLIRKKGKLPYDKVSYSYDLEYGSATIEMHTDSIDSKDLVLIHDDLLATGGSAQAAAELVKSQNGQIAGFNFLINLSFLGGDEKLKDYTENIINLATY
jgi:adenine phosphoribosyltransferase